MGGYVLTLWVLWLCVFSLLVNNVGILPRHCWSYLWTRVIQKVCGHFRYGAEGAPTRSCLEMFHARCDNTAPSESFLFMSVLCIRPCVITVLLFHYSIFLQDPENNQLDIWSLSLWLAVGIKQVWMVTAEKAQRQGILVRFSHFPLRSIWLRKKSKIWPDPKVIKNFKIVGECFYTHLAGVHLLPLKLLGLVATAQ